MMPISVLIIGCGGSTGIRYTKICLDLGVDIRLYDYTHSLLQLPLPQCTHAIIAGPNSHNLMYIEKLLDMGLMPSKILCEKPLSCVPAEHERICTKYGSLRVVCNWAYTRKDRVFIPHNGKPWIYYQSPNWGPEKYGLWNLFQLYHLDKKAVCYKGAWQVSVEGCNITLDDIEESYKRMLIDWLYYDSDMIWRARDTLQTHRMISQKIITPTAKDTPCPSQH